MCQYKSIVGPFYINRYICNIPWPVFGVKQNFELWRNVASDQYIVFHKVFISLCQLDEYQKFFTKTKITKIIETYRFFNPYIGNVHNLKETDILLR